VLVIHRFQEGIMSRLRKLASTLAAAAAAAALLSTSAFAETRHQNETWRDRDRDGDRDRGSYGRSYRDNDRVTLEGRIRSIDRDRDRYRVQLDRGSYSFYVPQHQIRNRARDFRVGASIRLGGVFRGGYIHVDVIDWPGNGGYYDDRHDDRYGYDRGTVRGYVDRVDYRRANIRLRVDGRFITVDMDQRYDRSNRRVDVNDLRRGDYVEIAGRWSRGGLFEGYRIETVRSGRR
jgi:hypothetical protein